MILRSKAGFSLVEMMAVTIIVGLLAAISVPLGEMIYQKAKEDEVVEAVSEVRRALDWYYDDHGYYPPVTAGENARDAMKKLVEQGYLRNLPTNPYTNSVSDWEIRDSTGSNWVELGSTMDRNINDSLATVSGTVRLNRVTDVMDIRFPSRYNMDRPDGRPMSTL